MTRKIPKKPAKHKQTDAANPMWGGQFEQGPDAVMARINASIGFDRKLYAQDIEGSLAHVAMLGKTGIINAKEAETIRKGLLAVKVEIEVGTFEFKENLEDIHMNIEARLAELIGDVAGKLHTARSRNDQVALDFRLYVRDAFQHTDRALKQLQAALIARAEEHTSTIMPGFTHLQTAQPVTLGHHLLAYTEMFGRDRSRIADALKRLNECPLGAAALAGTSFPIDRAQTAKALGFAQPTANSLDSVSDRDFALDYLSMASLCAIHLSRLAEEFIIWSSVPFGFIQLSDKFTSGSSIMPQKRNPDAAELVRGKSGRIIGALNSLLVTMKGLPLAYNKDAQEDKEPVFDASEQVQLCVLAMTGMVRDFTANKERMLAAASGGYSTATDLADWLVRKGGLTFRKAHHATARIVKEATKKNLSLTQMKLSDLQAIEPAITKDALGVLSVEASVASRVSHGGTAPARVKEAAKNARKKYL